ncbi:right-handed parallel beta-helix repeat-containing protein [Actinoplanes sp. L3-i22]|uniref:right-handed parallel beta-helix repeat-containing protein n=1 Tax=Actinoplanes sp. L3-i22 TaxID=2836373 RepID=UPI001C8521B0|nr:right-handed parallel beta-helix repeat-containing protein [Actinoplanes sp. L3-i22]
MRIGRRDDVVTDGATVRVAPGERGAAQTIAAAIRAVRPDQAIVLAAGVYQEELLIDRDVRIVAELGRGTVWLAGHTIRVTAGATLEDLVLAGADADEPLLQVESGTARVNGCELRGGRIEVTGTARLELRDSHLSGARLAGVYALGDSRVIVKRSRITEVDGIGVVAGGNARVTVTDTWIGAVSGSGLRARGNARIELDRGAISRPGRHGVLAEESSSVTMRDGAVERSSADGVLASGSARVELTGCRVTDVAGAGAVATETAEIVLTRCEVDRAATTGVVCRGDATVTVTGGTVRNSGGNGIFVTERGTVKLDRTSVGDSKFSAVHVGGTGTLTVDGAWLGPSAEHGLHVIGESRVEVTGARVHRCGLAGLSVDEHARVTMTGVILDANRNGVITGSDQPATVTDCLVSGAERAGVQVSGGASITITETRIERPGTAGIVFEQDSSGTVEKCSVHGAGGSGIVVWTGAKPTVRDTTCTAGGKNGLFVAERGGGEFTDCTFTGSAFPAIHIGAQADPRIIRARIRDTEIDVDVDDDARAVFEDVRLTDVPKSLLPAGTVKAVATSGGSSPSGGTSTDAPPEKEELPELLAELNALVGLDRVKQDVGAQIKLMQTVRRRQDAGLAAPPLSRHLVFAGNPGTGKTTVARLYGRLLHAMGMLERGHLIEADRTAMVGEYVGHTGPRTQAVFRKALGGVLFIDEAYSLVPPGHTNDFGQEAIATLVKLMEDHRDDVVVIVAGYTEEMSRFIASNPGLASRFSRTLTFEDYSADELTGIVESQCAHHEYQLADDARELLQAYFVGQDRDKGFGNGRAARQIFQRMTEHQAQRVADLSEPSTDDLLRLTLDDVPVVGSVG